MTRQFLLDKYQKWGCTLVPLKDNEKKPKSKLCADGKYHWKKKHYVEWTESELLAASRIGIDHEASDIIDIDFDAIGATKFMHLLPETLTIGKEVKDEK